MEERMFVRNTGARLGHHTQPCDPIPPLELDQNMFHPFTRSPSPEVGVEGRGKSSFLQISHVVLWSFFRSAYQPGAPALSLWQAQITDEVCHLKLCHVGTADRFKAFEGNPWESLTPRIIGEARKLVPIGHGLIFPVSHARIVNSTNNSFYCPIRERQEPWRSVLKETCQVRGKTIILSKDWYRLLSVELIFWVGRNELETLDQWGCWVRGLLPAQLIDPISQPVVKNDLSRPRQEVKLLLFADGHDAMDRKS